MEVDPMPVERVAAVVVTRNRKSLLVTCLKSLFSQTRTVQKVVVVDNASTDGTREQLKLDGYLDEPTVEYIRLEENIGGAGGFHVGAAWAYEAGYDWIWLMDDDGQPEHQTLESLLGKAAENGLSAICPVIVGESNLVQVYHHKNFDVLGREVSPFKSGIRREDLSPGLVKEMANAFVGPLVHRRVLDRVGLPIKEYFIWGDDTDYTLRIGKAFELYVYTGAVIHHNDGNYAFSKVPDRAQYWKVYYAVRNGLWIRRQHFGVLPNVFAFVWASLAALDPKIDWELRGKKIRGLLRGLGPIPTIAHP